MREEHKDCPQDIIEWRTLAGDVNNITVCEHYHKEDITADDGPVVGHHCYCCDKVWINNDYVMKGHQ